MILRRYLRRHRIITAERHTMAIGDNVVVKTAQREVIRLGRLVVPVSGWSWFEHIEWPLR